MPADRVGLSPCRVLSKARCSLPAESVLQKMSLLFLSAFFLTFPFSLTWRSQLSTFFFPAVSHVTEVARNSLLLSFSPCYHLTLQNYIILPLQVVGVGGSPSEVLCITSFASKFVMCVCVHASTPMVC